MGVLRYEKQQLDDQVIGHTSVSVHIVIRHTELCGDMCVVVVVSSFYVTPCDVGVERAVVRRHFRQCGQLQYGLKCCKAVCSVLIQYAVLQYGIMCCNM